MLTNHHMKEIAAYRCASLKKNLPSWTNWINEFCKEYGGGKPQDMVLHIIEMKIIRNIHGLEKLGYVEKVEKKGRVYLNRMQK